MSELSANLSLPLLMPAQAQKHVTHNEALQVLDALVQLVVIDRTQAAPPASPAEGDRHIVPAGATGWAGPAGSLAVFGQGAWTYHLPRDGWQAHVLAENRSLIWQGGDWVAPALRAAVLGVNAGADATNRLAVAAPATLFTHDGGGHQVKVNKAAPGNTASLLFQTGFSGRAEMGLAGNEDFSVKVSATGAAWSEALVAEAATGRVRLPAGLEVTGTVTGTAVQAGPADATPGRLLRSGAGGVLGAALDQGVADSFDTVPGGGFFGNTSGSSVPAGVPVAGQSHAGLLSRGNVNRALQVVANLTGTPARLWWRRQDTAWQAWRHVFDSGNVLGTVSQAGGVPTGALIERASNANGTWIRFADGLQICLSATLSGDVTVAAGAGFRSAALAWTFPAAFSTLSGLVVAGDGTNNSATHWASARAISVTQGELTLHGWTSVTGRTALGLAIGRWF